ncbi:hypothetical protein EVAR_4827_1 [Eumeta japonica]|uniref:Uncharacterized protein n=1 Tax=Eumeta variegata TaxID=151549 RepID=A0A4C1SZ38_EUMVA|nr:hypothetical protein EVAR_4827_1 [Eumeta japonica]
MESRRSAGLHAALDTLGLGLDKSLLNARRRNTTRHYKGVSVSVFQSSKTLWSGTGRYARAAGSGTADRLVACDRRPERSLRARALPRTINRTISVHIDLLVK